MKVSAKKSFGIVLLMAVLAMSSHGLADEQSQGGQTSGAKQELAITAPDMVEIIPLARKLSSRLAALENKLSGLPDCTVLEKQYAEIEEDLKGFAAQVQQLKDSKDYRHSKIANLKQVIKEENKLFEKTSKPLNNAIRKLGAWRKEWLAEKEHWNQWQSSMLKELLPDQIKSTFTKAHQTIDTALKLILEHLDMTLIIQVKDSNIQTQISELIAELDGLILAKKR